jgi:putative ABC transport system substrate-binding protein
MKRNLVGLLVLALVVVATVSCGQKEKEKISVGITQIVEHPALDAARDGFLEVLKASEFGDRLDIEIKSAQGDMSIAQNIAQSFVESKKDIILAIATPTAQAAYNATKEIPILITAVTDPIAAGLTGTNITGTSDATPIDKQFELMKKLIPKSKKVGIVYNMSEQNSEIQVNNAKAICGNYGIEIEAVGISSVNEMAQALDMLLTKVDVIYTPTDNLVASAMPLIVEKSIKAGVAVIGAESAHVEAGALATQGINYYNLGKQTGEMAIEVLRGKKASELEIKTLDETELIINVESAKKLNIELNPELKEQAKLI